jgi:hypothetical protein
MPTSETGVWISSHRKQPVLNNVLWSRSNTWNKLYKLYLQGLVSLFNVAYTIVLAVRGLLNLSGFLQADNVWEVFITFYRYFL